jgi:trk system potassium uptake protein
VNLSSIRLFRSLRVDKGKRQFAVIGLGRFGRAVCSTLHSLGYEVMAIDSDDRRVSNVLSDQIAVHVVQLDSTDPVALKEAGIAEYDTVIVAIGNYIQESIITTLNLKEAGIPHVVAKASSEMHVKLLQRMGADQVVFPEHEMGCELARSLSRPGILDRFELDPDHSIVEVLVPAEFDNKNIVELELRARYGLNLIAIADNDDKFEINPNPSTRLRKGAVMVLVGSNKGIEQLPV